LIPLIIKFDLQESVSWVAILETCMAAGTGAMAAGLSFVQSYKQIYQKIFMALMVMGCLLVAMGCFEIKPVLMIALFFTGAAVATIDALAISLFQHFVPFQMKGRFFSILSMVSFAGLPLSYTIFGFLSNIFSNTVLLYICGTGTLALSLLILRTPRISNEITK
jgi:MFS-type transporter involved in bile tolerance (Atg22 family)